MPLKQLRSWERMKTKTAYQVKAYESDILKKHTAGIWGLNQAEQLKVKWWPYEQKSRSKLKLLLLALQSTQH